MELRQLRYFVGCQRGRQRAQGAGTLHVAQPALSQQIAALEQELGAKLFERSSRGMTLTEAGRSSSITRRWCWRMWNARATRCASASAVPSGEVAIGLPTTHGARSPRCLSCRPAASACRRCGRRVVEGYSGYLREWLKIGPARPGPAVRRQRRTPWPGHGARCWTTGWCCSAQARARGRRRSCPLAALARWPLVLPGREHGLRKHHRRGLPAAGHRAAGGGRDRGAGQREEGGRGWHRQRPSCRSVSAVAEEWRPGACSASTIESASISRRVVCATSVTRPTSAAGAAVMALVIDVIRGMVEAGDWPARWVGEPAPTARATPSDA